MDKYFRAVYELMVPNQRHYTIVLMQVEIGVWEGTYQNQDMQWLRWWDLQGNLLPAGQEAASLERQEKEQALEEKDQALEELDQERLKRQQLVEKLRSLSSEQLEILGIDPKELM